jgi:hypothetical protein
LAQKALTMLLLYSRVNLLFFDWKEASMPTILTISDLVDAIELGEQSAKDGKVVSVEQVAKKLGIQL